MINFSKHKFSKLIGILAVFFVVAWFLFLFAPAVTEESGREYYLRPGLSKKHFITEMQQQKIINHPIFFSLYTLFNGNAVLKTGEYFFPKGSTPVSIWRQVTSGTGFVQHQFTIVPGWSFNQLRHELNQTKKLRHITSKLNNEEIMTRLGQQNLAPEGEFFPETYYYTMDIPDLVILKRAFDLMRNRLEYAWQERAQNLPYKKAYEALIAASIIEKEAYLSTERPIISSVLINRLKKGMLLQFDPTVIYGLGDRYDGKLHKENLQDNNPYNTYLHKGLPPTPISMPSMSAIEAALHPKESNYFYFVARGDGSHQFSETLLEHNLAVESSLKKPQSFFNDFRVKQYLSIILHTNMLG